MGLSVDTMHNFLIAPKRFSAQTLASAYIQFLLSDMCNSSDHGSCYAFGNP
jgi:hypothetical protein